VIEKCRWKDVKRGNKVKMTRGEKRILDGIARIWLTQVGADE
jgi:hypothetical protein